jgi:hypothetical protein
MAVRCCRAPRLCFALCSETEEDKDQRLNPNLAMKLLKLTITALIELNHIKNIVVHPVGLGDQNAKKPFYKPVEKNLGAGSFVEGFTSDNSYDGELEIGIGNEALEQAGVKSAALIKYGY